KYRVRHEGKRVGFDLVSDDCRPRRMILDRSTWSPASEVTSIPNRKIALTPGEVKRVPRKSSSNKGSWPSFRGNEASGIADGQNLPDRWDVKTSENILWTTP